MRHQWCYLLESWHFVPLIWYGLVNATTNHCPHGQQVYCQASMPVLCIFNWSCVCVSPVSLSLSMSDTYYSMFTVCLTLITACSQYVWHLLQHVHSMSDTYYSMFTVCLTLITACSQYNLQLYGWLSGRQFKESKHAVRSCAATHNAEVHDYITGVHIKWSQRINFIKSVRMVQCLDAVLVVFSPTEKNLCTTWNIWISCNLKKKWVFLISRSAVPSRNKIVCSVCQEDTTQCRNVFTHATKKLCAL